MTDHPRDPLFLQPTPVHPASGEASRAPWERPRRSRPQRGPDGRLLSEGDRRWMKELAERQQAAIDVDANGSPEVPAQE